jgi:hypothetical protein
MKRRSFVKASLMTTVSATILPQITKASDAIKKESTMFYELRVYTLKDAQQQILVENYFKDAAIPAYKRLGIQSIGLFAELKPDGQTKVYALIPFKTMAEFIDVDSKLFLDQAYLKAGETYLNAAATSPAYERIESSLLKAFTHMPKLELPEHKARIFELRLYEHATESAGKKKLEMFNDAGEIDIFKRLGFRPVFFGETIIGQKRPNLIYMVTFNDMADHDSRWKSFGGDPEWKTISSKPDYADSKLVSHITSTFLTPLPSSEI